MCFSTERTHLETLGKSYVVLLDFFLGEQTHSLQLLQLRDSLLNPMLNDLRHLVDAAVRLLFGDIKVINVNFKLKYHKTVSTEEDSLPHTCVEVVIRRSSSGSVCK